MLCRVARALVDNNMYFDMADYLGEMVQEKLKYVPMSFQQNPILRRILCQTATRQRISVIRSIQH